MAKSNKFGTFGGVFTPSILTILGVIMYMRLPMIIGEAGLYATIGIILIAHLISVTTGLSVSSIATDKKVEAGGTYFMISRSLGLPIGGTLGIALFIGLSFSVSLYLIGFSESFLGYWGLNNSIENIRIAGSAILLIVTIITFISTSLAIKTQYIIMTAIGLSLLSIFFGKHDFAPSVPFLTNSDSTIPLMVLFGIFFPAVTGFEAGVSMSGDLKDPKKSIPFGAITAIGVGLLVYIGLAFFFSFTVDHNLLATDPNVLLKIAWVPELVIAGIWGATLSSALGSILGAPRILQATAMDKITPRIFAKGTKKNNEPRNALLLTFAIAEAGILIGDLDVIARIVSIFFITTYGFLNISCAFERLTSADFRPAFKTPAWISIVGSVACIVVMIQLDFAALLVGIVFLGGIYSLIRRKELELESGDAWSSIWSSLVRTGLRKLQGENLKKRNWRPNIIMFSGIEESRPSMIKFGKDIAGRLGILTGFELIETSSEVIERKIDLGRMGKFAYFKNQYFCRNIFDGMDEIARTYGFNGIEPNTILMGWSNDKKNQAEFIKLIQRLEKNNFNTIFFKYNTTKEFGKLQTIDIWWSGWGSNLAFSINLIRHLTSSDSWNNPKVRLFVVTDDNTMIEIIYNSLRSILEVYRANMQINVINNSIERLSKNEIIVQNSINTDLTIVGIPDKKFNKIEETYDEVSRLSKQMGSMLFINSSKDFDEFNIVENERRITETELTERYNVNLPELIFTKYALLNKELENYDQRGLERETMLYDKVFAPFYREQSALIQDFKTLPISIFGNLIKLLDEKKKNANTQIIFDAFAELYEYSEEKINKLKTERIELQKSVLDSGVEWYNKQLLTDFVNTPIKIALKYDISDFYIDPTDNSVLKAYKRRKKLLHPFARKTISGDIQFRKIARYYIVQSRHKYLQALLNEVNIWGIQFLIDLKNWIFAFNNELLNVSSEIESGDFDTFLLTSKQAELIEKLTRIDELLESQKLDLKRKILAQFRNDIQLLANDLNKVNINVLISKKKQKDSVYKEIANSNSNFAQQWQVQFEPIVNKLLLDLHVFKLKNDCSKEVNELTTITKNLITTEFNSKLKEFDKSVCSLQISEIEKFVIPEVKIRNGFFDADEMLEVLRKKLNSGLNIIDDEVSVYNQSLVRSNAYDLNNNELTTIPLRKMAKHYIDSKLIGNIHDGLHFVDTELNKLNYKIKDQIVYMHFEFENTNLAENADTAVEIINSGRSTIKYIVSEVKSLNQIFSKTALKSIEETFEPLQSHKIVDTTNSLSQTLREFKNQKNLSVAQKILNSLKLYLKKITVRILYSQSEGVLLARKLNKRDEEISTSEKYLNLIDKVSPISEVYRSVPTYYKNLFSGHSSIGDDFWIERKSEEEQFKTALKHFKAGYKGGIFVTGERNSGKTALCQYITRHYFKVESVYHIFPPLQGSVLISDFEDELNAITNIDGNVYAVFEKLPLNSVLVFHDLELWWESSESGMTIIKLILDLIKKYSDKVLIIANINSASFQYINRIQNLTDSLIAEINCTSFDSEELKELVLRRHHSREMKFALGNKQENAISEIRLAKLFNRFFNFTNGNPGATLLAWIAHVAKFENNLLYMVAPEKPITGIFDSLPDDWKVILYQIYLHKRVTVSKLVNVLMIDEKQIVNTIDVFIRSGLIKEKSTDIYIINPYLDNLLAEYLSEQQ